MRIEQLEYVAALTQHDSLRKASDELHVSQPALSESLRNLERELGVTLLDRRRTGARLSREASELLPTIVEVLEAVRRLRALAGEQQAHVRTLRVGTVGAGTSAVLLPAIADLAREHPQTRVEVVDGRQPEVQGRLSDGSLDIGLVNVVAGDDLPPELHATALLTGGLTVCLPAGHPLAERESLTADDLRPHPFVAMRSGYLMYRLLDRLFGSEQPATITAATGAEMGKAMVAAGLGLSVLPSYSVVGDPAVAAGTVVHRPLATDGLRVSLLVLRRRFPRVPPAVAAFELALAARAGETAALLETPAASRGGATVVAV